MIKVQCPKCKNKVKPIDLMNYNCGCDNTKMCFKCRSYFAELRNKRKCRKLGCNKLGWNEPIGENKSTLHQYCKEHQKEKNAEFEKIMEKLKNWREKRDGR
ncbi:MAG: hypothetical protein NT076_01275 [Candidatus Pacearchaeota archaeon]|nr:hypothetical protein [Candidatus Pacearchaeota archaeon]